MLEPAQCDRLIVYGGSFDPPHRGHIELPFEVAERIGANGVMFVPSGSPPHKAGPVASGADRVAMLEAALGGRDDAMVYPWEVKRQAASYTLKTLEHLREQLGQSIDLRLLIGADMAASFYTWRDPRRIIELAEPVVMMRPPFDVERIIDSLPAELSDEEKSAWRDRLAPTRQIDIASTDLRRKLAAGDYDDSIVTDALPGPVLEYIRQRGLYRTSNKSEYTR